MLYLPYFGFEGRTPDPKRTMTRYEFAVAAARMMTEIGRDKGEIPPAALPALRRLVAEFAPELKQLGVSLPEYYRRLATPSPFADVPPTHWAAASVERLREEGIAVAYPNSEF